MCVSVSVSVCGAGITYHLEEGGRKEAGAVERTLKNKNPNHKDMGSKANMQCRRNTQTLFKHINFIIYTYYIMSYLYFCYII